MPIRVYKPTTPGRRKSSVIVDKELSKKRPEKSLIKIKKQKAGRSKGTITVRHRGGGAKRYIRIVDFKRNNFDKEAEVIALEYDPNRSANLALIQYENGKKNYIIAVDGLKVGDKVKSSMEKLDPKPGNCMPLEKVLPGATISCIELQPGKGAEMVRGAGSWAVLMGVEGKYAQLKLPSGEIRLVLKNCLATIGRVSRHEHRSVRVGKAGRKRHMGIRPTVRGTAMNPVDHPHGGGEGNQPIGLKHPKSPWGKAALGVKTRKPKKESNKLILKRRKKKKRK